MDAQEQTLAVTATGKRILQGLLNAYVMQHIGSSKIPYTDLEEAMRLQDQLERQA